MSDQYFIGIEDLDRVISKSFMDGKEDVRLEFMALRDVAIERMIKAAIEANKGASLIQVSTTHYWSGVQLEPYDSERLPAPGKSFPVCRHCDAELLGNQIFCPICGSKL